MSAGKEVKCRFGPEGFFGKVVRLRTTDVDRDLVDLYAAANGKAIEIGKFSIGPYDCNELLWKFIWIPQSPTLQDFREFIEKRLEKKDYHMYTIFHKETDKAIGSTMFLNHSLDNLTVEIGVWVSPVVQGTGMYVEACYLLLKYAFAQGYRRVEWNSIRQNQKSCMAAGKIGFIREIEAENFNIFREASVDLIKFRILDREWPESKSKIKKLLKPD